MAEKKTSLLELAKKNLNLILITAIVLIILNRYIVQILLFIFFGIIGMYSLKVTRMIPNISVETVSASVILLGYAYGWKTGLAYGVIFGMYGYIKISMIKLTTITNALFMGLCGVLAAMFHDFGLGFTSAFIWTFVIRANLGFLVFTALQPDPLGNIMHSYGDALFNVFITMQLMSVLYEVIVFLGGG